MPNSPLMEANRNSDTQRPVLSACWIQAYTTLPRASLLLIGGDLAYPNPSDYSYEKRLFRPFEDALPPPRHYHPGRVVLHKPDLPPDHPAFSLCDCDLG